MDMGEWVDSERVCRIQNAQNAGVREVDLFIRDYHAGLRRLAHLARSQSCLTRKWSHAVSVGENRATRDVSDGDVGAFWWLGGICICCY